MFQIILFSSSCLPETEFHTERKKMNILAATGIVGVVGLIAVLWVGFQLRDRLDKIADLLAKK
jgi:hypothetical protein